MLPQQSNNNLGQTNETKKEPTPAEKYQKFWGEFIKKLEGYQVVKPAERIKRDSYIQLMQQIGRYELFGIMKVLNNKNEVIGFSKTIDKDNSGMEAIAGVNVALKSALRVAWLNSNHLNVFSLMFDIVVFEKEVDSENHLTKKLVKMVFNTAKDFTTKAVLEFYIFES